MCVKIEKNKTSSISSIDLGYHLLIYEAKTYSLSPNDYIILFSYENNTT